MMVEKEDLGLSLSLTSSSVAASSDNHNHGRFPLRLSLMPMPMPMPIPMSMSPSPFFTDSKPQQHPQYHWPDLVSPSERLRGIDVNRAPAGERERESEEEAGVSSPNNSTLSSVSGKQLDLVPHGSGADELDTERACSRGSDEEDGEGSRKKLRLSKDQSAILEESFKEHNTLNPKQKVALAKQLNLRPRQVEVWFQNRRARTKLKQTEVDCEFLKRCCENLTEENRRLQKEVAELRALKLSPHFYMHMTPPTTLTMCPSLRLNPLRIRMGMSSKRPRDMDEDESSQEEAESDYLEEMEDGEEEGSNDDGSSQEEIGGDHLEDMEDGEEEVGGDEQQNAEMEELERQYQHLRHEEQDHLKNLKRHKDEDALKGLAIKNQKALWDKTLEFRFLLQKVFASSNKLPQESVRSSFCISSTEVDQAYSDLILSSKQTLNCMLELQEALVERNPSVIQDVESRKGSGKDEVSSDDIGGDGDEDWLQIHKMHSRIAPFRNISVDKWQRKTQVTTGAAAVKGKLQAFNQNISEQVAGYMRDPSKMIQRMQLRASSVGVFGKVPEDSDGTSKEDTNMDGDPELVDDSEFYQQLLKEFLESCDPTSSEVAFYALRKMQAKKRKIVDRRASKSRKIRYNVHEKIVNFMAPVPMVLPSMAPKLFENLFGYGNQKHASVI
ncbi:hypothetical protein J5N97_018611 [Dioscorea zingiberensis]|uniref:Homeobox domain-containing protein n=1 Tax=Dioscorea zingiberensis TaxID=325984 RepID=A0A9D5HBV6_9LILI|nr:hypothetical protein J5N97_018611 [Dioscorea zingiberensis]